MEWLTTKSKKLSYRAKEFNKVYYIFSNGSNGCVCVSNLRGLEEDWKFQVWNYLKQPRFGRRR